MRLLLLLPALLFVAGCASVDGGGAGAAGGQGTRGAAGVSLDWLRGFGDEELMGLAREAVEGNRDLRVVAARLEAARVGLGVTRGGLWPSAGLGVSGVESGVSEDGRLSSFEGTTKFQTGVNVSWEVDLWGRVRNGVRAAEGDFEAQAAEAEGAGLSLAGQTARAWCSLITARQQLALAEETREGFGRNLQVVERSFRNGDAFASALDVKFARNQVAAAGRSVEVQKLAGDEARRTLEVLLGRYPGAKIAGRNRMPVLAKGVPAGVPAWGLERRPDLRAARARVAAAGERAEGARKALLPGVTLTGAGSAAGGDLLRLLGDPGSLAGSIAASLTQPVFRGGALRAAAGQAAGLREAAVEAYGAAVLKALREVESALAAGVSLERQYRLLETEVEQAGLAERQASREYSQGTVGFLSVLEAQRRAVSARGQLISLMNARLQNRIDLHLALGGGFE